MNKGKHTEHGADHKGIQTLRKFERLQLTQQMRAADDPVHARHLEKMRNLETPFPVSKEFLAGLHILTAEDVAREGNNLRFAPIGVLSQIELHALNHSQARAFARYNNRPLLWRRNKLTGNAAGWLTEDEEKIVYEEERAALCSLFVQGAPAVVTHNINTGHGIVNDCDAVQHSITLDDGSASLDHIVANVWAKTQAQGQGNNSLLEVEIPVPLSVNVMPTVTPERKAKLLRNGASLDADELVLPILIGARSVTHRVTSLEAARRCTPRDLRLFKHDADLAFALTDCKVQGKTPEYFILSLGLRSFAPYLKLSDLYVLASRVKEGKKLYATGLKDATETSTAHLRKLHQAPALALWYHACNSSGKWTGALIRQKAAAMCRHTQPKRRATKEANPKKKAKC